MDDEWMTAWKKNERDMNDGKITKREYEQRLANLECDINGVEPLYPWI